MKDNWKIAYMDVAERFAEESYATRLHVGAIVVKDNRIISIGINGMPSGWENVCEHKEYMPVDALQWMTIEEIEDQYPHQEMEYPGDTDLERWRNRRGRRYALKSKPEVLHAERNALDKLARSTESGEDAMMFVTHSPCLECAKSIYGAGISEIFYKTEYRSDAGIKFLEKCGVKVTKI